MASETGRERAKVLRFHLTDVEPGWASVASRYALSQLSGGRGVESETHATLATASSLIANRRSAVKRLKDAGWEPMESWLNYVFTMNCPPVGVFVAKRKERVLQPCNRVHFCPFCWCRQYVSGPFVRFQEALFDEFERLITPRSLLEIHYSCRYDHDEDLLALFHALSVTRRQLVGRVGRPGDRLSGAYAVSFVAPTTSGWAIHCRVLGILADDDYEPAPKQATNCESLRAVKHNLDGGLQQLASSLGRVASYPATLILGRTETTLELLNSMPDHVRMCAYYGQLQGGRTDPE